MQTIAVLITCHNRKEKTLKCLETLLGQTNITDFIVDVYLTDDGCTDGTPEAIKAEYPQVHIIHGDGNLYWNRGMHKAWEVAARTKDYDFYLWLNDDVELKNNALAHILFCSKEKGDNALISGLVSTPNGTLFIGGRIGRKRIRVVPNGEIQKIDIMTSGNLVLIPKSVFKQIGFNDPYYRHSFGDVDYSLMVKKKNIGLYVTKECEGFCEIDVKTRKCFQKDIPFSQRWRFLHTPLSYSMPNEIFYFNKKHYNVFIAIYHYVSVYLRCLFPMLWGKIKKLFYKKQFF